MRWLTVPTSITHRVGDSTVTRVTEQHGLGFAPQHLFPDWDPTVVEEYREWMVPDCYDETKQRLIASIHTWVVRTKHNTILIDTCVGNHKERPSLRGFHQLRLPFLKRLAATGTHPDVVDYVLCTHLHADHCGWNTQLLDGRWVPTFPNAKYVFSKAEQEHWSGPAGREGIHAGVYQDSVLPIIEAGQAEVIDGAGEVGGVLQFQPTPGHSVGHVAIRLASQGVEGLFTGDVMHHPIQIYRPAWNSFFCSIPDLARASRLWALEHAAESQAMLFTSHFPRSSVGHVHRHGDQYTWKFQH